MSAEPMSRPSADPGAPLVDPTRRGIDRRRAAGEIEAFLVGDPDVVVAAAVSPPEIRFGAVVSVLDRRHVDVHHCRA